VVQRLRVRFAKRGRLRFLSHRDVARAFERAILRAGLPVAYSAGFTPHWVGAAPTGAASLAEYVEIGLAEPRDPGRARADLDASLPSGLDVLECVPAAGGSLADRVDASLWLMRLPADSAVLAAQALSRFLRLDRCEVERRTKDGRRQLDARSAVVHAVVTAGGGAGSLVDAGGLTGADAERNCAILGCVVRHTTPAVRPDDVLAALRVAAGFEAAASVATRLAQGRWEGGYVLADPLAPDVMAAGRGTSAAPGCGSAAVGA
jgi:radical SAM-linked protein